MPPSMTWLLGAVLLVAGCVSPARNDQGDPPDPDPMPPGSGGDAPIPASSTDAGDGVRRERWHGNIYLHAAGAHSLHSDPHGLRLAAPALLTLEVTASGGVALGDLRVSVVPSDDWEHPVLEAEGPTPLTASGQVPAGTWLVFVRGGDGAGVNRTFGAEAWWAE